MEVTAPILRRSILTVLTPVNRSIGHWHFPVSGRLVTDRDRLACLGLAAKGDVLLCRRRQELSNWIIPGFWKHVALVVAPGEVLEATGKGAIRRPLSDFLAEKDYVSLHEAAFASVREREIAADWAASLRGKPYDYLLEYSQTRVNQAFYCSEIPWWAYEMVFKNEGKASPFTPRLTMGVPTVTPQDYDNAKEKWPVKWSSESYQDLLTR